MRRLPVIIFLFCCAVGLAAQERDSLDWEIDSVFDEPLQELPADEPQAEPLQGQASAGSLLQRRGFLVEAGFEFVGGIGPGWNNTPWSDNWNENDFYLDRYIKMIGAFSIDAQISEVFRVKSVIRFDPPDLIPKLGDFFVDYKLYDTVFFRGGKFSQSWGISPNYGFTDLLSRVPAREDEKYADDSYIIKADVPIGTGGVQALALTRIDLMSSGDIQPKIDDFGLGGKYNLALRWIDLDAGVFYQEGMPLRGFVSLKTTFRNTELYNEWLGAIDVYEPSNMSGAVNLGFGRDFFGGKLNVNGELFYNGEKDASFYQPETNIRESATIPFIDGFNIAFNFRYKPWRRGNPLVFLRTLYAPMEKSAQLIPGFRLNPWRHIEFSLAFPMGLGEENGYYYKNTLTVDKEKNPLPFAVIFLITLKGSIQFGYYY